MRIYYASLVRGLTGYYVKFKAPNEEVVRRHLSLYFGRMWCSVYTALGLADLTEKYECKVVNEDNPIVLTTGEWE